MNASYELSGNGELLMSRNNESCIAYLAIVEGETRLCIMEGGAYHSFAIGRKALARLSAECAGRIWDTEQSDYI